VPVAAVFFELSTHWLLRGALHIIASWCGAEFTLNAGGWIIKSVDTISYPVRLTVPLELNRGLGNLNSLPFALWAV
jgi:hypothetical protein